MDFHNLKLPWPAVEVPEYRPYQSKHWRCSKTPMGFLHGYWTPYVAYPSGWMIEQKKATKWARWMSLTPMEKESHQPHIKAATGFTMVCGLGMGMYLYNILCKPEVHHVVCIEKDRRVIAMFKAIADSHNWPGIEKLTIIKSDALDYIPITKPDFLYVDIWEHLGSGKSLPLSTHIQKNVQAHKVGYWTQEFDFVTYMMDRKIPIMKVNQDLYHDFCRYVELPLIEQDSPQYAYLAAAAVALQTSMLVKGSTSALENDLIMMQVENLLIKASAKARDLPLAP